MVTTCLLLLKQPDMGRRLAQRLRSPGRSITLLSSPVPRSEFVALMNRARVTLYLPHEREGFYLPALEGMAVQTVVVCPDCVGNRSFCVAGRTCLRPAHTEGALAEAVEAALALSGVERADMLASQASDEDLERVIALMNAIEEGAGGNDGES